MTGLLRDIRYACRTLARSPGFTIVSLLTAAVGIGANTAIFSFVDSALLKPLPYRDADRIVSVLEKPPNFPRNGISTLNYLDWRRQSNVFESMAPQRGGQVTLSGFGEPVQIRASYVGAHYFEVFGVRAMLGRTFASDEDEPGKEQVAMLSHALWVSQFGGDKELIGKGIVLDGASYIVIGVLPAGGAFDRAFNQLYLPLAFKPENMTRNFHWFGSFAKLKTGVSLQQAKSQMDAIGTRIAQEYPDSNKGWGVAVERYADLLVNENLRRSLYVLLAAVGMVLLIGCANLANLTLARGATKERDVAVRSALGANRQRLIRQFVTENVLLSLAGGVLGLGVAHLTLNALKAALPPFALPKEVDVTMDGRVLVFAFAISALTGILIGLVPALSAANTNPVAALKEGARGTIGGSRRKLRTALVIGEVSLAFVLLTGAGLLIRSFFQMQQADTGFDSTNVITAQLPLSDKLHPDPVELNLYLRQIVHEVQSLPAVRDVALTSALPMRGWGYGMPFQIAHRSFVDRSNRPSCFFKMVSPSYFQTIGMRLLRGRGLTDRDLPGAPPTAVINETMARKYFAGEDPIGKRILVQQIVPGKSQLGPEIPWEVVGEVADERVTDLNNKRDNPGIYVTNDQSPAYFVGLVVKTEMAPTQLENAIRKSVYGVNKDQPLADVKLLEQIKNESMAGDRLRSVLLAVFAAIALLLSAIGIYGVISYSVAQRTSEIGIRAALGANRGTLLGMILGQGMRMTGIGLAIGLLGAFGLTRLLASLLFGIGAWDPLTIASVAAVLIGVGLLACYVPARRATSVDAAVALRYE